MVDDNSKDGTKEILQNLKKNKKNFKFYIRKNPIKDLSQSILLGVARSKFDNLVIMDGDLQHDPKYLPILINIFEKKKIEALIASRKFDKIKGLSFVRKLLSQVLIIIINLLFDIKTSDPMSGYFLIKKKIVFEVYNELYCKGYKILFDILTSSKKIKSIDYPITFPKRLKNKSKMNYKILLILIHMIYKKFLKTKFTKFFN